MTGMMPCRRRTPGGVALTVAVVCAGSMLLSSGAEARQAGDDFDCTDFDSRADAQAFYEETGGPLYDPFNLDDDDDGVACEEWMRGYDEAAADGVYGLDGIDLDCADFASQGAAQQYFVQDGGSALVNVDHLDPNHDGVACGAGEPG